MKQKGLAIILSAPSGTGKTTICQKLKTDFPNIKFSISHTTRSPRNNEIDGKDYFFISENKFQKMIKEGKLLEWAEIYGNYYGTAHTTIKNILDQGNDLILEIDVQGVEKLKQINFNGVYIFILPPSLEELKSRLKGRGTESADKINQRYEAGKQEIKKWSLYDYVLTNNVVEDVVKKIAAIIQAEKSKTNRYQSSCPNLKELMEMD